ncbi:uncharacterized protein LOC112140289 [Oryzias melastigma]|uniref:uncharacterized protein LOC112140289 n=1 Tax=Oryzias melastigma TaxID=30732 RepID=UPI000CF7FA4D|nr:uncharacterized protein LOC112140289 [Oryzias melastigma]
MASKGSKSSVSGKSSVSSASTVGRARAKAEAAKIRAEYATKQKELKLEAANMEFEATKKEAELQLEKIKLQAEMEVLNLQCEAEVTAREAQVLEMAEELQVVDEASSTEHHDRMKRTGEYVRSQNTLKGSASTIHLPHACQPHMDNEKCSFVVEIKKDKSINCSQEGVKRAFEEKDETNQPSNTRIEMKTKREDIRKPERNEDRNFQPYSPRWLNVHAQPFPPPPSKDPAAFPTPATEPLAQYLARRDLTNSGLYQFDDKPENYRGWYASFCSVTSDIQLSAVQQLDLMIKWLGKESREYVKRIRGVYANNPAAALTKAWERLEECYGAPEVIERSLFERLETFPYLNPRDNIKLREYGDLLTEILGFKEDGYLIGLSYLDTSRGILPLVGKLPYNLQEKWLSAGSRYEEDNNGHFPPSWYFCEFVCYEAKKRNDPSFINQKNVAAFSKQERTTFRKNDRTFTVQKTDFSLPQPIKTTGVDPNVICPLHNKPHSLQSCKAFRNEPIEERKIFLKKNGICFKCCASTLYLAKDCRTSVRCQVCDSTYHVTTMHPGTQPPKALPPPKLDGEEDVTVNPDPTEISSNCTEVCGKGQFSRSCAKICLAKIYPQDAVHKIVKAYVVIDNQSNRSLARPEFFSLFGIESEPSSYLLKTCSGLEETSGRKAEGFFIESIDGRIAIPLPPLIECSNIPNNRTEIPTPNDVIHQPHLQHLSKHLPELDPDAEILLLLGRDALRLHKVRQQVNGPHNAPFAQRLDLGWVVIGEVCLGNIHKPVVNTFKTTVLENGRHSIFQPCTSYMQVKEALPKLHHVTKVTEGSLGKTVFNRTDQDNKPAPSIEDAKFMEKMDAEVHKNCDNTWVAPLPFKESRTRLPNNKEQAVNRVLSLKKLFKRNPKMQEQYFAFMDKLLQNGHAEVAPPLEDNEECWFLPTFGVYHSKKPNQIRVVFDSSSQYQGICLNDVLLTGPDLNNTLIGVLLRFRKEKVAVLADIQQMFYCFEVRESHRNFLRFLWYKENDINKEIVEYRMKVHVFGNSPSPAVATYGLRRAIQEGASKYGNDTVQFVERHFYVDDGLVSVPTEDQAIDLLKRTQASLAESNIRLHKFISNSQTVLEAFCQEDCAVATKDLDLTGETDTIQRSLGLLWEISTDTFTFSVSMESKPFTRRGVLSTVNSIFDPIGLLAPVTVCGRALLRELTADLSDWDTPLADEKHGKWDLWCKSLQDLKQLHIPRTYMDISLSNSKHVELAVFSDASTKAIGAVAYLKAVSTDDHSETGLIMAKGRLAPKSEPTIPRLELCAAVLATELADLIRDEMDVKLDNVNFYSDSKVVLGYIHNETKRFYVYVHNRIQRIRHSSKPQQWHYVPSEENPADHISRFLPPSQLTQTNWFCGPAFLQKTVDEEIHTSEGFELIQPESDTEIRPEVKTYSTHLKTNYLNPDRFQRFSSLQPLLRAVVRLRHIATSFKHTSGGGPCKGWHWCEKPRSPEEMDKAMNVILQSEQGSAFPKELSALHAQKPISKDSCLLNFCPVIRNNLICVGGRLDNSDLETHERHPVILPKNGHIALLLTRHYHVQVKHQGRHFTEGAIRAAGYWILSGKRLICTVIHNCVTCRKLRGKVEEQRMADLPVERLQVCPPFTYVGLDVFGPWMVASRRTRGGHAENKRWAIMFSCLSSRAVHIELIESMDSSSCINALRRFFAMRGPAKQLMSDCGTNFIGASKELGMDKNSLDSKVQKYLDGCGCVWKFNPPHASHMGGSWERMIGVSRRILDSLLLQSKVRLTHEVLSTLMAEVVAIMNARPLIPVSSDPDNPQVLSPSILLTQKSGVSPPLADFSEKDMFTKQWRQVQALANQFWTRWRKEYLPCLQGRQKWTTLRKDLKVGDVVLLKDKAAERNHWPMARIKNTFPGSDGHIRQVEVNTIDQGRVKTFSRPITEVVLLIPNDV